MLVHRQSPRGACGSRRSGCILDGNRRDAVTLPGTHREEFL